MTAPVEDAFVGAALDKGQADGDTDFDAGQYSFFGDLTAADGSLEGALEEGLEAPPEEELALDPDLQLDDGEDLSYASMFALGLDGEAEEEARSLLLDTAPGGAAAAAGRGANSLGHSLEEVQEAHLTTPPVKLKPGSIALGGLLAGTPSGLSSTPLGQGTPYGSLPGSSGAFLGGSGFGGTSIGLSQPLQPPLSQPPQQSFQDPAIAHMGPPQPQLGPMGLPGMQPPARPVLSAQELEAQLLGGRGGMLQQGMGQPPPPPQYPHMPPPMPPPGHYLPPPHHMHGPPPPPPGMQQQPFPPQPPFDVNGLPYHRSPPPMHGGPPRGPMVPPGFRPDGMMQRPPMMPPGFRPDGMMQRPDGMMQQHPHQRPFMPPPPPHGPMPPPLGAGRGAMARPGMGQQGMRYPGGGGPFRPQVPGGGHMGPPMHPGVGGPWARGPFPPGFQQQHQPPTLAQRLRALNLADRWEADRFPMLRRRYYSKYMDHEEIESILHMQWKPLHMGSPYVEDYYYQAFVYKHYNKRNKRSFAPESVRELAPTEKVAPDQVAFVKLEGLGKVPFSNIRRPRPLMDLTPHQEQEGQSGEAAAAEGGASASAGADGGAGEAAPSKPLEQEPLLAARIMIEDCMALLLDVEDIDRIFVAAGGAPLENEGALRTRRVLLVEGFAVSLRLPETPVASGCEMSDGVFVRLMSLPKGKTLTARALRLVYPPPEEQQPDTARQADAAPEQQAVQRQRQPNLWVAWAVMRNLRGLFSGKAAAGRGSKDAFAVKDDLAASAKLAASAADLVKQLPQAQDVCDCMAALLAGDLDGTSLGGAEAVLLPLFAPGHKATDTQVPWLCDIIIALLQRATELDLLQDSGPAAEPAAELAPLWERQFAGLYALVHRHVSALHEAFRAGREVGDAAGCAEVRSLVPIGLIRTMLPHCAKAQQDEMRAILVDFGA